MVSETRDSVCSHLVMSLSKVAKKRDAFMVDSVTVLSSSAANTCTDRRQQSPGGQQQGCRLDSFVYTRAPKLVIAVVPTSSVLRSLNVCL